MAFEDVISCVGFFERFRADGFIKLDVLSYKNLRLALAITYIFTTFFFSNALGCPTYFSPYPSLPSSVDYGIKILVPLIDNLVKQIWAAGRLAYARYGIPCK